MQTNTELTLAEQVALRKQQTGAKSTKASAEDFNKYNVLFGDEFLGTFDAHKDNEKAKQFIELVGLALNGAVEFKLKGASDNGKSEALANLIAQMSKA